MTYDIVGTRRVDIPAGDTQRAVSGWTCYCVHDEPGVNGVMSEKIFFSDVLLSRDCPGRLPVPGAVVDFEYNRAGRILAIREIVLPG